MESASTPKSGRGADMAKRPGRAITRLMHCNKEVPIRSTRWRWRVAPRHGTEAPAASASICSKILILATRQLASRARSDDQLLSHKNLMPPDRHSFYEGSSRDRHPKLPRRRSTEITRPFALIYWRRTASTLLATSPRRSPWKVLSHYDGPRNYTFRKASRSALIVSACVVGIPCGKSL
jgi:hypothetical protein